MRTIPPPRPLPPGVFRGRIFSADVASLEWRRSDRNPRGLVVRIGVEVDAVDGPAGVYDVIDVDRDDRIARVFAAAGIARRGDELGRDVEDLLGLEVEFVSKNVCPLHGRNAGKSKAVVGSWLSAR